jgi:hypothetical protein
MASTNLEAPRLTRDILREAGTHDYPASLTCADPDSLYQDDVQSTAILQTHDPHPALRHWRALSEPERAGRFEVRARNISRAGTKDDHEWDLTPFWNRWRPEVSARFVGHQEGTKHEWERMRGEEGPWTLQGTLLVSSYGERPTNLQCHTAEAILGNHRPRHRICSMYAIMMVSFGVRYAMTPSIGIVRRGRHFELFI